MLFLQSFLQYVVIFIILAALAVAGVFLGKFLRTRKDAKDAALAAAEKTND